MKCTSGDCCLGCCWSLLMILQILMAAILHTLYLYNSGVYFLQSSKIPSWSGTSVARQWVFKYSFPGLMLLWLNFILHFLDFIRALDCLSSQVWVFVYLLHCGNIRKFNWHHTAVVQMVFSLCVDLWLGVPSMAKTNSVGSLGKLSVCIAWFLDVCHEATWSSVFASPQQHVSVVACRAVPAFSRVLLPLSVGVLRPSPGW